MPHKVTEDCINCGACDSACNFEAISEKDDRRAIDPEKCTDCGACLEVCPAEAIKAE